MTNGAAKPANWRGLLTHPVLHFVLIGAVLFGVNAWRHSGDQAPEDAAIHVDPPRLQALAGIWRAQFGRAPTEAELGAVAHSWALEEMRVREARRMGLDQDDSVIRRRLAQKYDFLINNPSALGQPSDAVLQAYLSAHADRYAGPSRYSFDQVYFSNDRGPAMALAAAQAALKDPDHARGDDFPGEMVEHDVTEPEVRQDFGSNFAAALPKLKVGVWQGPVESGFGLHLVRITRKTALAAPVLKDVRGQVVADWMSDQSSAAAARAAADLAARYHVSIDEAAVRSVAASGGAR